MAVAPGNDRLLERARLGLILLLGAVACGGDARRGARGLPIPGETGGPRLVVEVLNASGRPGLARTGTRVLRQAGIDVVFFGNAGAGEGVLDSTRVVVRRGTAAVGDRVRAALRAGAVSVELDSSRLLDVSVFLGADFVPRLGFHP